MAPHRAAVFRTSRHVRLGSKVAAGKDPDKPVAEMSRNSRAAGAARAMLPTRPGLPARLNRRSEAGSDVTASIRRWHKARLGQSLQHTTTLHRNKPVCAQGPHWQCYTQHRTCTACRVQGNLQCMMAQADGTPLLMLPDSPELSRFKRLMLLPIHAEALPCGSVVFRALLDRSTSSNPLLVARSAAAREGYLCHCLAAHGKTTNGSDAADPSSDAHQV